MISDSAYICCDVIQMCLKDVGKIDLHLMQESINRLHNFCGLIWPDLQTEIYNLDSLNHIFSTPAKIWFHHLGLDIIIQTISCWLVAGNDK